MQESESMHKIPTRAALQAFAHESSKVGGRGRETGKTEASEADGKKGSPTKQNVSEKLKQGLYMHSSS